MAIDENGKVTFDENEQAKVDEIVKDRLARAKNTKPEDYDSLKELANELDEFGFKGTLAEKKAAIKQQRESYNKEQELEQLQEEAQESGFSNAGNKRIKYLEDRLEVLSKAEEARREKQQEKATETENQKKADEEWNKQLEEFNEAYEDIDLEALGKNSKFIKFVKGKTLPLIELYKDFRELIGETESEAIIKVKSKQMRSTSSGNSSAGGSHGLSTDERKVVDDWNKSNPKMKMTYKEYSNRR